jgi:hypothetical protein
MPIGIRVRLGVLLCSICVLTINFAEGAAADSIEDPQQSCEALAQWIGAGDAAKLADRMASDSRGGMDESAVAGAQQIVTFAKQLGRFVLAEFMAKHEFGERFRRYWYLVLFEDSETLYLYCEYLKPDDGWQLMNVKFNTDFDKLSAP